jgi:hypothetical protein
MATTKEREKFVSALAQALPDKPYHVVAHSARLLMRHAHTHQRLSEESCNGHPAQGSPTMDARVIGKLQEKWDARIERQETQIERRITEICAELGIKPDFQGDPRGYTVKVHLPTGVYNTWGGQESGFGVPS